MTIRWVPAVTVWTGPRVGGRVDGNVGWVLMGDGFSVRNLLLAMMSLDFFFHSSTKNKKEINLLVGWLAVLTFRPDVER